MIDLTVFKTPLTVKVDPEYALKVAEKFGTTELADEWRSIGETSVTQFLAEYGAIAYRSIYFSGEVDIKLLVWVSPPYVVFRPTLDGEDGVVIREYDPDRDGDDGAVMTKEMDLLAFSNIAACLDAHDFSVAMIAAYSTHNPEK